MLKIENLYINYGETSVLRNISLSLRKGDSLAIIGESGAGKTTLALSVMGLCKGTKTGRIVWNDRELLTLNENELRSIRGNEISLVFQNTGDALHPLYRIIEQVKEALLVHSLPEGKAAEEKALQLLELVGMKDMREYYPHQLSGGQKQKVLIAMAIANEPDLIILDEPTTSLDPVTRIEILGLIKNIAKNRIIILITHDISTVYSLTEETAVLYNGEILEKHNTAELLNDPLHPYTRGLIRSYPAMDRTKDLQGIPGRMHRNIRGCVFHERCTQHIDKCLDIKPELVKHGERLIACHRGGIVPLLEARELAAFYDNKIIIKNIDFNLYEGETLALVGESGSGKTTLAMAIMGLCGSTGEIRLDSVPVGKRDKEFFSRIQIVMQNPKETISHRFNVLQAVSEPLDIMKKTHEDDVKGRVISVLQDVELPCDDSFLAEYPHHLSMGEIQRLAIARSLILNPKILIADEPTSSLDPSVQGKLLKLFMNLQEKRGMAILFITHDIAIARKISDRIMVMLDGNIIEEGFSNIIINKPAHPYTRQLVESAPSFENKIDNGLNKKNNILAAATGCAYYKRCDIAGEECLNTVPRLITTDNRKVACFGIERGLENCN